MNVVIRREYRLRLQFVPPFGLVLVASALVLGASASPHAAASQGHVAANRRLDRSPEVRHDFALRI